MASAFGTACDRCGRDLLRQDLDTHLHVCPDCGHHRRLGGPARLRTLLDDGAWTEHDAELASTDPLSFSDRRTYTDRLADAMAATGLRDAAIAATGTICGVAVEVVAMDHRFLGGTLGMVTGEKVVRTADRARAARRPLLLVCASSGARIMEGALSLMQMAKIGVALGQLDRDGIPHVALLTDPTTGGVVLGCAMGAALVLAEPDAQIGFTPPAAIQQTTGHPLPNGFQRSEYLLDHGLIDLVVDRRELRGVLGRLLGVITDTTPAPEPPRGKPSVESGDERSRN